MHYHFWILGCVLAATTFLLFYGPRMRQRGATIENIAWGGGDGEPMWTYNGTEEVDEVHRQDLNSLHGVKDGNEDLNLDLELKAGEEGEIVAAQGNLYDVQNNTLGFQGVYMINLPERSDKRDAFAVQAKLSNISYTLVEGVDGATVSGDALPYKMDIDSKAVGCWRSHLNILRDMVERNVATALVFEDDADWDVALKMQLVQFARGSRFLTNTPEDGDSPSPYGDDWDLLWIGHCSSRNDQSFDDQQLDNRRFVIPDDPTVLTPEMRVEYDRPSMQPWNNDRRTRIVYVPTWGSCTAAYAVSLRGAEKILYHQSLLPFNDEIDEGLAQMAMFKIADFKAIAPYPPLVGVSKPAGPMERWSDLGHTEDWEKGQNVEEGFSERVMFSTRQNIDRLIRHETVFRAKNGWELGIDEIGKAVGHAEWLTEEQMPQKNGPGSMEEQKANEVQMANKNPPEMVDPQIYPAEFLSMVTEMGTHAAEATPIPTTVVAESNTAEVKPELTAIENEASATKTNLTQASTSTSVESKATETQAKAQQEGSAG